MAAQGDPSAGAAAASGADWPGYDKFAAVQEILDRNALLISQINSNHATRTPEAVQRNVLLIKELNSNVNKCVEVYQELAAAFMPQPGAAAAPDGMAAAMQQQLAALAAQATLGR